MNKIRILTVFAIALGCVSLAWMIYNLPTYNHIIAGLEQGEVIGTVEEMIILSGLLSLFLFHIVALTATVVQFYHEKKAGFLRAAALFVGPISMFLVFGDWAAMHDIYTQTMGGLESSGEWSLLYIQHAFHLTFLLLSLATNIGFLRRLKAGKVDIEPVRRDETLFLAAQYFGIASGALGVGIMCLVYGYAVPEWYDLPRGLPAVISVVILAPYGLIVACWLVAKFRETPVEWYDEKQFNDIARAGFFTLLLLLPCMAVIYSMEQLGGLVNLNILWFYIYMFLTLGFFSGGTLYFSTRR